MGRVVRVVAVLLVLGLLVGAWWKLGAAVSVPAHAPAPAAEAARVEARPEEAPAERPNLVVVLLDDLGIDQLASYGSKVPLRTPSLDALAARGVSFRRVWAHPTCSPTRAAVMTGRWPFRYGIGEHLSPVHAGVELPLEEVTIAEALAPFGYTSAVIGKWHVGLPTKQSGLQHPLLQGFARHRGSFNNLQNPEGVPANAYNSFEKVIDGTVVRERTYATTDTTNDALRASQELPEPWFLWVAYNAPHTPLHVPPARLLSAPPPKEADDRERYRLMVEALDTELGRMVRGLESTSDRPLWVLVIGDNGTPRHGQAKRSWFDDHEAKGAVYEGGVRVPLWVVGPEVPAAQVSRALVSDVDLFPTLLDLAGVPAADPARAHLDGLSFLSAVRDPEDPGLRTHVLSEHFHRNGPPPYKEWLWMVTDGRHKLVVEQGQPDELYDFEAGWPEKEDLLSSTPSAEALAVRERLHAAEQDLRRER